MVRPLSAWARAALWAGGAGWVVAVMLAVWSVRLHDLRVAVGFETWLVPLAVALALAAVGAALHAVMAAVAHRASSAAVTAVVLPLLAVVSLVPAAWTAPPAPEPPPGKTMGPDIVLVTLDTFRADHLGVLGGRASTPRLDALAADGALFTNVVTTSPLTAPAHASMLTGLVPREHGLVENGRRLDALTVVGPLSGRRRAGAFVSSLVLDRRTGLDDSFHHYDDRFSWGQRLAHLPLVGLFAGPGPIRRSGDLTVARALRWLDGSHQRAFCWIHLYDPHAPYEPPRPFRPAVAADPADPVVQRLLYQGAISWTDALVGQIVDGVSPGTGLIVVGDHGESLGEHGDWFNHGGDLYEPAMRVPMVVRWPTVAPGFVVDRLVSVADVTAMLVEADRDGSNPLHAILGTPVQAVEMYTTGQQQTGPRAPPSAGFRLEAAKLVSRQGQVAYFDLAADPGETSPLAVPDALDDYVVRTEQALNATPAALTPAQEEWLRLLGYLE